MNNKVARVGIGEIAVKIPAYGHLVDGFVMPEPCNANCPLYQWESEECSVELGEYKKDDNRLAHGLSLFPSTNCPGSRL
jgi:hypothetical protein